jgi:hypothetical protein
MFTMLNQSNFDIAMGEFLLDLAVGTACMMVQPGDDVQPLNFIPVPLFLVSYEEGANGQVDNVYRRMRMKGESIQRQWPDAKIPDDLKRHIENKPTDDIELLEATIFDQKRGDYCYHVIWKQGSKSELVYRRRKMSPWVSSPLHEGGRRDLWPRPADDCAARHQDAEQGQRAAAKERQPGCGRCLHRRR